MSVERITFVAPAESACSTACIYSGLPANRFMFFPGIPLDPWRNGIIAVQQKSGLTISFTFSELSFYKVKKYDKNIIFLYFEILTS
jgi:hypothetical protein